MFTSSQLLILGTVLWCLFSVVRSVTSARASERTLEVESLAALSYGERQLNRIACSVTDSEQYSGLLRQELKTLLSEVEELELEIDWLKNLKGLTPPLPSPDKSR